MVQADINFAPSPEVLQKVEAEASSVSVPTDKHLAVEQAVSEMDQYFTCTICLMVVEDPKECQECNQLCCSACIEQWRQRENSCPNCRCQINLGKNVNRFVLQSLNSTMFNCDKCSQQFSYEERQEHWQSCGNQIKCKISGCPHADRVFDFKESLRLHWLHECLAIELTCSYCGAKVKRGDIAGHRCDYALKEINEALRQRVKELEQENGQLKAQLSARPPAGQQPNQPQNQLMCSKGHNMNHKSQAFARYTASGSFGQGHNLACNICRRSFQASGGYYRCDNDMCDYDICSNCAQSSRQGFSNLHCNKEHLLVFKNTNFPRYTSAGQVAQGQNLFCNLCQSRFHASNGYYRCNDTHCDFDVCKSCGENGRAEHQFPEHIARPDLPAQQSDNQHRPYTCKRHHPLVFMPFHQQKQRARNDGHLYQVSGDNLRCDACGKMCNGRQMGGSYTCEQSCDFDLCANCARCANGHQLTKCYGNPYPAGMAPRCDRCGNMISQRDQQSGFSRCEGCKYDVCRNCIPQYYCFR